MGADLDRAAALHRSAAATVAALGPAGSTGHHAVDSYASQHEIAEQLRSLAARLAPGWWGAPLDAQAAAMPIGGLEHVGHLRIGTAQPLDDARFPVVVPFLGTGHLAVDGDVRDRRVAGLLRATLLRLLAAVPHRRLVVRTVDGIATGGAGTFAPFQRLIDDGVLRPAATELTGLRAALAEAEQWIRPARPAVARHHRQGRFMLLLIASLPESTDGSDLDRIARLAQVGPEHGLHLVVAGWPPPPLTPEQTRTELPHSTTLRLRNPHVLVGDPPGESFADPGPAVSGAAAGLGAPVYLDASPPQQLIDRVGAELTALADAGARPALTELLPDPATQLWTESVADGLAAGAGFDGHRQVVLRFNDITPNWLVAGRAGAGVDEFVATVLYGLAVRHRPADLAVHLVDLSPGETFAGVLPTDHDPAWLPHVQTAGAEADPEYALSVLRLLTAEIDRRIWLSSRNGVNRFAELVAVAEVGRILCVLKNPAPLLATGAVTAGEALDLLTRISRSGRSCGVHLLLADSGEEPDTGAVLGGGPGGAQFGRSDDPSDATSWHDESLLSHFPVRVALPGGDWLLEPKNDSAAGLPVGSAVINTASGLGGPRGAVRGHERTVNFPDPYADLAGLARLRHQIWSRRESDARPPQVFAGFSRPDLPAFSRPGSATEPDDRPAATEPGGQPATADSAGPPTCLLGHAVEVPQRVAEFRFERAPGRHLAIFGSRDLTMELLTTAVLTLAAQHAPGTARMLLVSLGEHDRQQLATLAGLIDGRQPTEIVDLDILRTLGEATGPAYLVVATADVLELGGPAAARLRNLLDSGPSRGIHLLSCWQQAAPFTAFLGPSPELIAGVALLDLPVAGIPGLADRLPGWHPRHQRGLLYDAQTDRYTIFIPFRPVLVPDDAARSTR